MMNNQVIERTLAVADTLKEIVGGVDMQEIENVMHVLIRAKQDDRKIYLMAAGRANLIIRTFAMRLMQIGFYAYVVFNTNTPAMEAGDVLIAGSGSGTTGTVVAIARQAKKIGGQVILFTKNADTPLAKEADAVLRIPTERCTQKLQSKGSEFEQSMFLLCDNISVELMLRLNCIKTIDQVDGFIKVLHANLQ